MNKKIIKAQNREELDKMIARSMTTLTEDETVRVKVISEPKKILFFNVKGTYEVEIVKKSEVSKENVKKEFKVENNFEKNNKNLKNNRTNEFKKNEYKEKNNVSNVKANNKVEKNNSNEKVEKNVENSKVEIKTDTRDANIDKIRSFIKEFIVKTKLDIVIVKIEKVSERYVVNVDGKDIRYLIGEKGSTLNCVEYLLSSVKPLKNIKVVIDSNNYKDKREEALRDLARKKGKKVQETGRLIKLNPMSARERKIIHEEISNMRGLKTESIGEEPKRYLVIKSTKFEKTRNNNNDYKNRNRVKIENEVQNENE